MMASEDVNVQVRAQNYDNQEKDTKKKEPTVLETTPLHIEKSSSDIVL